MSNYTCHALYISDPSQDAYTTESFRAKHNFLLAFVVGRLSRRESSKFNLGLLALVLLAELPSSIDIKACQRGISLGPPQVKTGYIGTPFPLSPAAGLRESSSR